ncbi:MAG: MFS transporter [Thermoleophilaceae bacterium]
MPTDERRLRLVLAACAMAMFATNLDFFALQPALPDMARDFDAPTTNIQWVISGYMLALGAFLIPGGRVGDILGRKRMLIVGLAIFGVTSLVCGLAPSDEVLIAFRVLQGLGAAMLFPISVAVITNAFPPERTKRAIGNLYGLAAVATALGPFVGGALTKALDWRAVLLINIPIALIAIGLALRSVEESRDDSVPRTIDVPGLLAIVTGISAVTFAVDRGESWGWTSAATLATFALGVAALLAFIAIERRVPWPLVDLKLFGNRPYVLVTALGTVANVAFVAAMFAITLYLQEARGYSPLEAGLIFIASSAMAAVAGPLSGRLAERFDVPALMATGTAIGAAGLFVVSLVTDLWIFVPALAVFGLGYSIGWVLSSIGTQTVVAPERAGEASGVTLAILVGVAGLFVAVAATAIELVAQGGTGLGTAVEEVLRALAIGSGVLALALMLLRRAVARA